jgi:hypothetical protein
MQIFARLRFYSCQKEVKVYQLTIIFLVKYYCYIIINILLTDGVQKNEQLVSDQSATKDWN